MELLHILNYVIQQEAKRLSDWSNPSSVFDTVYNYMFICLLWKRNIFSHQRFIEYTKSRSPKRYGPLLHFMKVLKAFLVLKFV